RRSVTGSLVSEATERGLPPALAHAVGALNGAGPGAARASALERLLEVTREELEAARVAQREDAPRALRALFAGREEEFAATLDHLTRAAGTALPALIEGERGTGKSLVALAHQRMGPRRDAPARWVDARRGLGPDELRAAWQEAAG